MPMLIHEYMYLEVTLKITITKPQHIQYLSLSEGIHSFKEFKDKL